MFKMPCPQCLRSLRLPEQAVGHYVRCPACQTRFPVTALPTVDDSAFGWLMEDAAAAEREGEEAYEARVNQQRRQLAAAG